LTEKNDRSILAAVQIDHLTVPVRDYEVAKRFYADTLEPLGYRLVLDWPDNRRAYFGLPSQPSSFWVVESVFAGALEVSLAVADRAAVVAFHAAALAAGARSLAEPGERERRRYGARIADFDGNALEALCREAETLASDRAAA
jgi:catechol 2,3-dioxygenase-like lactoylglutathione lyase family enzyme